MNSVIVISIAMTIVGAATPLIIAALGELVAEKSGVLNLGVEGMMLIGAVIGFAVTWTSGSHGIGIIAAAIGGGIAALMFAFLTLTLMTNQVVSGLALTLFGTGFSALVGRSFSGTKIDVFGSIFPDFLASHSVLKIVFGYSPLVYFAFAMVFLVAWFFNKTRAGLIVRAVGESDVSAFSLGFPVIAIRYACVVFGGLMAGIAGGFYSMVLTPLWSEELTAGRGWIALALVVFASWLPYRLALGAFLFGAVMTFELQAKAIGFSLVPSEFLAALPYMATIVALVLFSLSSRGSINSPVCLGKPFKPST